MLRNRISLRPGLAVIALAFLLEWQTEDVHAAEASESTAEADAAIDAWLEGPGLTGEWAGWRAKLQTLGISPYAVSTNEILRNFDGGLETDTSWTGLLEFGLRLDLEKLIDWKGGGVHTSVLWLYSNNPSSVRFVGNYEEMSNIAGNQGLHVFRLYLAQTLAEGTLRLKLGQLALDDDFMVSQAAALFIYSSFGALPVQSANSPAPIYPLGSLGGMLDWRPDKDVRLLVGLYNGDAGSETSNSNGFDYGFGQSEGVMAIAEVQTDFDLLDRAARMKLGGFYDSGEFADYENGDTDRGLFSLYAVWDQVLLGTRDDRELAAFLRLGFSPVEERSAIRWYFDAGFTARGFRPQDRVGIGISFVSYGDDFISAQSAAGSPIVDNTTILELTYRAQLTPWFFLQPDFQVVFDPQNSAASDAIIGGLRGELKF